MAKKLTVLLFVLFLCIVIVLTAKQIGLNILGNKIIVKMWEDNKNPYLFSEKNRIIQGKLNKILSFNLKEYQPIQENGFWNQETENALEAFRDLYYKKYNLQRYYAFSAGEKMDLTEWESVINRELPNPASFVQENQEKMQIKLGDPARYYGNSANNEIQRIEKGLADNFINPVTGELTKTIPFYTSPMGNDHLLPIQIAARYGSQTTYEGGIGLGWFLTENSSLWYSFEKNEVVVQDGTGLSQEYEYKNGAFVIKGEDKTGGYFAQITLENGNMGAEGSRIVVQTKKGDRLIFECKVDSGGDSVQTILAQVNNCGIIRGYSIDRNEYEDRQVISSITTNWSKGGKVETNYTTKNMKKDPYTGGVMGNQIDTKNSDKQTIGLGDCKSEFIRDVNNYLVNNTVKGFSVSFWADQVSGTNAKAFSYSQKSSTNITPDLYAGYQMTETRNRYGSYKKYDYDSKGNLFSVISFAPDGSTADQAGFDYEGDLIKRIRFNQGGVSLEYQTNAFSHSLKKAGLSIDGKDVLHQFGYTEMIVASMADSNLLDVRGKLQDNEKSLLKSSMDIQQEIDGINSLKPYQKYKIKSDKVVDFLGIFSWNESKDIVYSGEYIGYLKDRFNEIKGQIQDNIKEIEKQIDDINNGKYSKRVMVLKDYRQSIDNWNTQQSFNYKPFEMSVFNTTNSEAAVRVVGITTPASSAQLDYTGNTTFFTDPNQQKYSFIIDNRLELKMEDRRIKKIQYPDSSFVQMEYDNKGNIKDFKNEKGDSYQYSYDENGNVLSKALPDSRSWKYQYANPIAKYLGEPTRIDQPDDSYYELQYNELGELTLQKLGSEVITEIRYNRNPDGSYVKTVYDQYRSPTVYQYGRNHNLVSKTNPDGALSIYGCDAMGKVLKETSQNVPFFNEYDSRGNVIRQGIEGKTVSLNTFDGLGRKIQSTDAENNTFRYAYDTVGRVSKTILPDGQISFQYDPNGNKILDDYGSWKIQYEYDSKNQLARQTQLDKEAKYETDLGYDIAGNLITQAMIGRGWGGSSSSLESKMGVSSAVVSNGYSYNSVGMLQKETDYLTGETAEYQYDKLGRVIFETHKLYGKVVVWQNDYDLFGRKTRTQVQKDGGNWTTLESVQYLTDRSAVKTDTYDNRSTTYYDFRNNVTNLTYWIFNPLSGQNEAVNHSYQFDGFGNKVKEIYPDSTINEWHYDNGSWLTEESKKYRPGETTVWKKYENNKKGQPVKITDFNGKVWKRTYEYHGLIAAGTDPENRQATYQYDMLGNRITENIGNKVTHYEYNYFKKPIRISYSDGTQIKMGYDALGNMSYRQAGNYNQEIVAYDGRNKVIGAIDPSGLVLKNSYDFEGNLIKKELSKGPDSRAWNYSYNERNKLVSETSPDNTSVTHSYIWNDGLLKETVTQGRKVEEISYDQMYREIRRIIFDDTLMSVSDYPFYRGKGIISGKVFNKAGLPVFVIAPGNRQERFEYSSTGKIIKETNPIGEVKTIEYDNGDNMTTLHDFDENIYRYQYDNSGKMTVSENPDGGKTVYTYGNDGSLKGKVLPGGAQWLYEVNSRNLTIRETNPFGGTTVYDYDAMGRRTSEIRPDGGKISYTYDNSGRLLEILTPGNSSGSPSDIHVAGSPGAAVAQGDFKTDFFYNSFGETNRIVYPDNGTEETDYDSNGRIIEKRRGLYNGSDGISGTVTRTHYAYNPEGIVNKITYPGGLAEGFEYNQAGLLVKKLIITNDVTCRETSYQYGSTGSPQAASGTGYGNMESSTDYRGITSTTYFDAAGRVTNQTEETKDRKRSVVSEYGQENNQRTVVSYRVNGDSAIVDNWTKEYKDFRGVTRSIKKKFNGNTLITFVRNVKPSGMTDFERTLQDGDVWLETRFTYDDSRGALISRNDPSGLITTYQYDSMGRVIEKNESGKRSRFNYLTSGQVKDVDIAGLQSEAYDYDYRGNIISKRDRLSGTVASAVYDVFGNKTEDSVSWGGVVIGKSSVYDESGRLIKAINETGGVTEYEYDALGTLRLRSETGLKTETYQYDSMGNMTVKTERDGINNKAYTYRYEYDEWGSQKTAVYPDNTKETAEFDIWGRKIKEADRFGYSSTMAYDNNGQMTGVTNETPSGVLGVQYIYDVIGHRKYEKTGDREHTIYYDARGLEVKEEFLIESGKVSQNFSYDIFGNKTAVVDFNGNTQTTAYDAVGRVIRRVSPSGNTVNISYAYDGGGSRLESRQVMFEGNSVVTKTIVDGFGQTTAKIDALGNSEKTIYTITSSGTGLLGTSVSSQASAPSWGREVLTTDRMGNKTKRVYDAFGRLVSTTDCYGKVLSNEYDGFGNIVKVTDKNEKTLARDYDWQNRAIKTTDALGNTAAFSYKVGRWEDKACELEEATDAEGNVNKTYRCGRQTLAIVDPLGNTTRYKYDIYGNLVETIDAKGHISRMEYDLRGNVTARITDLGFKTKYEYDANGRQIYEDNGLDWIKTTYDADGNVTSKNYNDWNSKTFIYDSLGRLAEAKDINSDYSYRYDANGNLIEKRDLKNKDSISYSYDANGNRSTLRQNFGRLSLSAQGSSGGKTVYYQYDGLNQVVRETALTTRTNGSYLTNLVITYSYDSMQRITNKAFSTGLQTVYQYDDIYRLTKIENYTNASTGSAQAPLSARMFSSLSYVYDKVGNRLTETEVNSPPGSLSSSEREGEKRVSSFLYDKDYRLISADYGDGNREAFTYDAVGNRLTKTSLAGIKTETVNYVYDNDNRLLTEQYGDDSFTRYTYDAAGRVIKKEHGDKTERFTYDSRDLMIQYALTEGSSLTLTKYGYDVENLRVSKKGTVNRVEVQKKGTVYYEVPMSSDEVRFTYDGRNILTEGPASPPGPLSKTGEGVYTSFYLNNIEINSYEAEIQPLNTAVYIKDAIGSVRGELYTRPLTTAKSEVLTHRMFEYTAFGEKLTPLAPSLSAGKEGEKSSKVKDGIGFTGHFGDTESNLYYARARYLDPTVGRFLTRDPVQDENRKNSPAGLNAYQYGLNNPCAYTDPEGQWIHLLIGGIIGGIIGFGLGVWGAATQGANFWQAIGAGFAGSIAGAAAGVAIAALGPAVLAGGTGGALALLASIGIGAAGGAAANLAGQAATLSMKGDSFESLSWTEVEMSAFLGGSLGGAAATEDYKKLASTLIDPVHGVFGDWANVSVNTEYSMTFDKQNQEMLKNKESAEANHDIIEQKNREATALKLQQAQKEAEMAGQMDQAQLEQMRKAGEQYAQYLEKQSEILQAKQQQARNDYLSGKVTMKVPSDMIADWNMEINAKLGNYSFLPGNTAPDYTYNSTLPMQSMNGNFYYGDYYSSQEDYQAAKMYQMNEIAPIVMAPAVALGLMSGVGLGYMGASAAFMAFSETVAGQALMYTGSALSVYGFASTAMNGQPMNLQKGVEMGMMGLGALPFLGLAGKSAYRFGSWAMESPIMNYRLAASLNLDWFLTGTKSEQLLLSEKSYIGIKSGTLNNLEARQWYLQQESKISGLLNSSAPIDEQAWQAFKMRNNLRTQARELMSDRLEATRLMQEEPNLNWNQIVQKTMDKGYTGDDIYRYIIESSQRSRASINIQLELK